MSFKHANPSHYNRKLSLAVSAFLFLSVSLPDTGKPKCFHTLDLKLAGASAVSQTLSVSSSSLPDTFALLLDL